MKIDTQEFHLLLAIAILFAKAVCDFFKIPIDAGLLYAILLALNIYPRPQAPVLPGPISADPQSTDPKPE